MDDDKVAQFVSVTDSSESVARKYLEACAGDIDMAIGMHLESQVTVNSTPGDSDTSQKGGSVAQDSEDYLDPMSYEKVYVTF